MKVALVRPRYKTHLITPPLGLGYVSSFLKKQGHDVFFIDALNEDLGNDEVAEKVKDYPAVGITVLSAFYLEAKELTAKLKDLGKIVIWGGVHPTVLPEETLADTVADYAIVGEGELTMNELLKALENNEPIDDLPGIYATSKTTPFEPRRFIACLDDLPFPDWQAMDPRSYQKAPHGGLIKHFPVAPITSTRGCPYECTFCVSPKMWQQKIRWRSPENVVQEIAYLVNNFGVKEIHFEDDNLTLSRAHIENICHLIIEKGIKISWATPNGIRADKVDEPLLRLMKQAGCYYVAFGVESANQEILKTIKKHETLAAIEKGVKMAAAAGLTTQGFFIFGLPGETVETIKESIAFAKRLPFDRAQFLLLDLLPGSKLWEEFKHEFKVDYAKQSYQDVTWAPKTIDPQILKKMQPLAFRQFFFRPRVLWSAAKYFKLSQIKFILKRLKDFRIFNILKNEK